MSGAGPSHGRYNLRCGIGLARHHRLHQATDKHMLEQYIILDGNMREYIFGSCNNEGVWQTMVGV